MLVLLAIHLQGPEMECERRDARGAVEHSTHGRWAAGLKKADAEVFANYPTRNGINCAGSFT